MDRTVTYPSVEKSQVKFHNQHAKKATKSYEKKVNFPSLQQEFNIRDEFADVEREFEIQYEQFLSNISGKRINARKNDLPVEQQTAFGAASG